jgi:hypothetical protein
MYGYDHCYEKFDLKLMSYLIKYKSIKIRLWSSL